MTHLSALKNWINIAIQQPVDDQLEMFYYDTNTKQFFSVLIIDLYLFDTKLNVIEGISKYYAKEDLTLLKNRVKRIFKQKSSIITLPKYGIIEDEEKKNQLIEAFLIQHKIDLKTSSLLVTFQKDPIPFSSKTNSKQITKPWWKIW